MRKILCYAFLILSLPLWAQESVETEVETDTSFNPRKSHWLTTFGFEGMEYKLPFAFPGQKNKIKEDNYQLYGGRLGFGGELYLGAGFMTSTRVEGYFMGTLFTKAKNAGPDIDNLEFTYTKDSGQIYGGDVVQTLGFLFDMKTKNPFIEEWAYLTVEPFIEAGFGIARAWNKKRYKYDTAPEITENYNHSFYDELTNFKLGVGINFTSSSGYFLTLKATQNRYDISKRKSAGYIHPDGGSRTPLNATIENVDIDPVTIFSLGGGYKF